LLSADYDDQYTIRLQLSHPAVEAMTGMQNAFSVRDFNNTAFAVLSTAAGVNQSEIVLTMTNFSTAVSPVTVSHNPALIPFSPVFEPPKGYAAERLSAGVTNVVLLVSSVTYLPGCIAENLSVAVVSLSIVATKVGSNPL
jgi:hypothetical protein